MPGGWKRSAHYNPWAGLPAARSVLPHPPRLIFPSGSIPPAELPAVAGQTVPVPERHCRRGLSPVSRWWRFGRNLITQTRPNGPKATQDSPYASTKD